MNSSPTTVVDSLALFNVLRILAQGTLFDVDALKKSAQDPNSDLAKLVAANNVSVQMNVCGNGNPDVAEALALDNAKLRKMLGEATCAGKPYTAMGEFNCTVEVPHIDYMRDSLATLQEKLDKRRAARDTSDRVSVDRKALEEVVTAFRSSSTQLVIGQWSKMCLGHCAAGQLGRDLDKAVREKTIT